MLGAPNHPCMVINLQPDALRSTNDINFLLISPLRIEPSVVIPFFLFLSVQAFQKGVGSAYYRKRVPLLTPLIYENEHHQQALLGRILDSSHRKIWKNGLQFTVRSSFIFDQPIASCLIIMRHYTPIARFTPR